METITAAINKLPPEILCLILSKLPLDNVCVCRGVLKSWNQLIQQPSFAKLHRSVSPLAITVVGHTFNDGEHTRFGFVELNSSRNSGFRSYTLNVADKVINVPRLQFLLVGSCNGLICLTSYEVASYVNRDDAVLVLCNPILGTHFFLPDHPSVKLGHTMPPRFGFGYIPSLGQYKVVKIAHTRDKRRLVSYVCAVECGRKRKITVLQPWRETTGIADDADGLITKLVHCYSPPVFFRGCIIWRAELCKDVGVYYDHEGTDHLYICKENISCTNIWVMETYKCMESSCMRLKWQVRIKWVIQVPDIKTSPLKLYKVFEDGKLLISIQNSKLVHYDPSTGIMETLDSLQFPGEWNELALDSPSLLGCMLQKH